MTNIDDSKIYIKYAKQVINKEILASQYIIKACKRFLDWFNRNDMYFDYEDVDKKIRFVSKMKHSTGEFNNKPFILADWQQWIFASIFGWKWNASGYRVTKKALMFIARKNGKSSLAAAIALCCAICDKEPDAEIDCVANNSKQAALAFGYIKNYAESLDPKGRLFKRYRSSINIPLTKSKILVHSSESMGLDGFNASCVLIDEFHASKTWDLYNVMMSSTAMRTQPLVLVITTAGFLVGDEYPLYSMCNTCKEVLDGVLEDDSQFAALYQLDDEDDWKDQANWTKCSPGYPTIVQDSYMQEQIKSATNNPSLEAGVRTKALNQFIQTENIWLQYDLLLKATQKFDMTMFSADDYYCYGGIDLAESGDLAAFSAMVVKDDKYYFKTWYFLAQDTVENSPNRELYKKWQREGHLIVSPGKTTNYDYIIDKIMEVYGVIPILQILYDAWKAKRFALECEINHGLIMTKYGQTTGNFTAPTLEFERLLKEGQVIIDDNPITRWCFMNAELLIEKTNGNCKPVKGNGVNNKIDGVISMLECLGGYMNNIMPIGKVTTI